MPIWPSDIYLGAQMTILGAEVTWIRLTLPHFCVCPKPGLFAFFFFFVFNDLRWEVVVYFVDIGGKMTINTQCSREAANTSFIVFGLTRSGQYQCYSLWFDTTRAQTHDLPHSRQVFVLFNTCTWIWMKYLPLDIKQQSINHPSL